ncbi:LAMA2 [Branchiostoma lanceolatum]|uniref:LAMA2 protein n=1 Tax=Branchiostoma lanceolatum TaxID=7740 RepID=A0A8J9ZWQ7_BRALA|nr:LAMA2 [Branchiostoma lanceolatum]
MSAVVTTEVPGVNSAIEHMMDLKWRMKSVKFGFEEPDLGHLDVVAAALKELDGERLKVHDVLEVETIKASILRHQLMFLPEQVKAEISEAVQSARDSNAAEMNRLRTQLENLTQSIEQLEKKSQLLKKENETLLPERDIVRNQHDEIISQLNQRMADKAGKQITLNETREKLRETNQEILDVEQAIIDLKEDMIEERANARLEKKRLKDNIADTQLKIRDQKETNEGLKKQISDLMEELLESDTKNGEQKKTIRRSENMVERLVSQVKQLEEQLEKEKEENVQLDKEGDRLKEEFEGIKKDLTGKKAELQQRLQELEEETQEALEENQQVESRRAHLKAETKKAVEEMEYSAAKLEELREISRQGKAELTRLAEESARLRMENQELEQGIEQLQENHKAAIQMLNKQVEESREQLTRERNDRFELQSKKTDTHKDLEEFRASSSRFMGEMNRRMEEGKNKHIQLTEEGKRLQKETIEDQQAIKKLKSNIKAAEKNYKEMEKSSKREIEGLEQSVSKLEKGIEDIGTELEEKTPMCDTFESEFKEISKEYEERKKYVVQSKNKKSGLDDAVNRAKRQIEKMSHPRGKLQDDLKSGRASALQQLRDHAAEVKSVEQDIYESGRKLEQVVDENKRFKAANKNLQNEIVGFKEDIERNKSQRDRLQELSALLKGQVVEGWVSDIAAQKESAERDSQILEDISSLQEKSKEREQKLTDITSKLEGELGLLVSFLDNVASRRPVDTRQSMRPEDGAPVDSQPVVLTRTGRRQVKRPSLAPSNPTALLSNWKP